MELYEEQKYLKRIAKGDSNAFEWLFFRYHPKLLFFLTGFTHDEELSKDMSQDIFLSFWKNREKLSSVKHFSSYLYTVARYTLYHYYSHLSQQTKFLGLSEITNVDTIEEELFVKDLLVSLDNVIEKMPTKRKLIFKLSRIEGLSNDEISSMLNISKKTVENNLTITLHELRKVLFVFCLLHWA